VRTNVLYSTLCGLKVTIEAASHPRLDAAGSSTIPAPLQPLSATLYELQMQLEYLRPLLASYNANPNSNTNTTVSPIPARQRVFSTDPSTYHDSKAGVEKRGLATLNPLANSYMATGSIQARSQTTPAYGLGASLFPHPTVGGSIGPRQPQGISSKNGGNAAGTTVGGTRLEI
jgi:hypothetical protein